MTTIGCFHAHYSNIEHVERALAAYHVELVHFVDPGIDRVKKDAEFDSRLAEQKVIDTLDWISKCHVDAILITCTWVAASLHDERLSRYSIPIIKIDEPLFQAACELNKPVILVFTNPNTVAGTLDQMKQYLTVAGKEIDVESRLLEHTFELIMQGAREEYLAAVSEGLQRITEENPQAAIIAAQLSMVPAAEKVELRTGRWIGNSLMALTAHLEQALRLERK
ncbi:MAG: hypothetical protein K0R67_2842 [Paenibacillus sp.]|nr:hypothetical protein [Paenibacillus sp.]